MFRNLIKIIISVLIFISCTLPAKANDHIVVIHFFYSEGCPHCANQKPFLSELENKYPEVKVLSYEVSENLDNRNLLIEVGEKLNAQVSAVPFTVVGDEHFVGWLNKDTQGKAIELAVTNAINNDNKDIVSELLNQVQINKNNEKFTTKIDDSEKNLSKELTLPIIGTINLKNYSLPILTIVLGALDGFNPCAMWTLLFLISLLLGMKNKKRRYILGTTFILASAFVYFLFMAAWLNLLLFIGFIIWVRILIGIIAIAGGGYNLKEYFTNIDGGCKVTGTEKRQKVFEKLKNITQQKNFILALVGIIVLAFAVNLVELICSAGLPVVFTQILTLSNLSNLQYYAYMILYIFVFMLDDLLIFIAAMITLEITGISTKYSRISHLIGGIIMIIIGAILIFKPEVLMFG